MEELTEQEKQSLAELIQARKNKYARRYTLEQKQLIVKAHLSNHVTQEELSKNFDIPRVTIWRWIRTFADAKTETPHPGASHPGASAAVHAADAIPTFKEKPTPIVLPMPKKTDPPKSPQADELTRLQQENQRLTNLLKMANLKLHISEVMIEEAEKTFNIQIRKKSDTK